VNRRLNKNTVFLLVLGFIFSGTAQAQGVTVGTYNVGLGPDCATLVLTGAGPAGNSYIYDEKCDGSADYTAKRVKVTSRGISVDQGRTSKISTNAKGFTGDWSLGGRSTKGVIFTRK